MRSFKLALLMALIASLVEGCAVYAPPPAYPQYQAYPAAPGYQAAPAYAPPAYMAPQPVYSPPVWLGLNVGFWGHQHGGYHR